MTQTTYYEFNKPEATDLVNPLVDTNPNWDALDADLHEFNERSISNCTEVVTLGVHAISRLDTTAKFLKWIATANFIAGETFTVDGLTVAASTPAGAALATGAYVTGTVVLACLNADNTGMTIFVSGTTVASDAERLGGELPSYYAKQSDMTTAGTDITNLQNKMGNSSIVGIGDGTATGAIVAINNDLASVTSNNKTLLDTITAFSTSTTYSIDISGYNEVEFEILGNYSSTSNKYHVVKRFKVEDIMEVVSDTTNKNTDLNAPSISIVCAVRNTDNASLLIGFVDSTTWKFNKIATTYNINSVKVYGCK